MVNKIVIKLQQKLILNIYVKIVKNLKELVLFVKNKEHIIQINLKRKLNKKMLNLLLMMVMMIIKEEM